MYLLMKAVGKVSYYIAWDITIKVASRVEKIEVFKKS